MLDVDDKVGNSRPAEISGSHNQCRPHSTVRTSNWLLFVSQGAIAVYDSTIRVEPATFFGGNRATDGAGGGVYCAVSVASFNGAFFAENEAVWGGGWCRLVCWPFGRTSRGGDTVQRCPLFYSM